MIPDKLRRQLEAANKLEWFENRVQELKDRNLLRETQAKAQALQELGPLPEVKDKPQKPVEEGEDVGLIAAVRWVFSNIDKKDSKDWTCSPPNGGVNMLEWAQGDGKHHFYTAFVTKIMPKDLLGKEGSKLEDDGRDQLELCNKLRAVVDAQRASGSVPPPA